MNFFRWIYRTAVGNGDDDGSSAAATPMIQARETTRSLIGRLQRERMILQARVNQLERDAAEAKRHRRPEQAKEMMKRRRLLINELENIEKRLLNIEQANMEISALETNRDMLTGMEQINEAAAQLQRDGELSLDRLDAITDQWSETQETSREISDRLTSPDLFLNPDDEHYESMMGADDEALLDELDALMAIDNNNKQVIESTPMEVVYHPSVPEEQQQQQQQPTQSRRTLVDELI